MRKWRWRKWLERRRARRELRAEQKQVSDEGTREKTSKSHALKGETPEVPEQRTEAKPVADAEGEPACCATPRAPEGVAPRGALPGSPDGRERQVPPEGHYKQQVHSIYPQIV